MMLFDLFRPAPRPDPALRAKIALAVTAVSPLIHQLGDHEQQLAPAVRRALDHCAALAARIPGPYPISRAAFAADPFVHALFGSPDDIDRMFATSRCVSEHLDSMTRTGGSCCALLGMRLNEKAGFGTQLVGSTVRRDVTQTTLSFSEHTLSAPGPDSEAARKQLRDLFFAGIVKEIAAHVAAARAEREQFQQEQALAHAAARVAPATDAAVRIREMAELDARLAEGVAALQPQALLTTLRDALAAPESFLHLDPIDLCVDAGGVILSCASEGARPLRFFRLAGRDPRHWVVLLARIDPADVQHARERFADQSRYIVI